VTLKRLAEQDVLDSDERRLSELLSSSAPFQDDPFRKRRIWVRLEREIDAPKRPRRLWLRPVAIAGLLISGTAMAELGDRYVLHGSGFLNLSSAPAGTSGNVMVSPRPLHSVKLAARAPVTASEQTAPLESAAPVEAHPVEARLPEAAAGARTAPKNARSRPEEGEDATAVVEAIQALRTERNAARAQTLLNDYLKSNPHGTLSGDALALSIEAASAQHDPRAAEYARRYLAAYPKGKYRDLAKRALEAQR